MKKKLQKLIREWLVIPKYDKRISELNNKIMELTESMQYFQSQMYHYKKINKDLRLLMKEQIDENKTIRLSRKDSGATKKQKRN